MPTFDRVRKHSTGERFKPSLAAIKASSRGDVNGDSNGEVRKNTQLKLSSHSLTEGRTQNADDSVSRSRRKILQFFLYVPRINWLRRSVTIVKLYSHPFLNSSSCKFVGVRAKLETLLLKRVVRSTRITSICFQSDCVCRNPLGYFYTFLDKVVRRLDIYRPHL